MQGRPKKKGFEIGWEVLNPNSTNLSRTDRGSMQKYSRKNPTGCNNNKQNDKVIYSDPPTTEFLWRRSLELT